VARVVVGVVVKVHGLGAKVAALGGVGMGEPGALQHHVENAGVVHHVEVGRGGHLEEVEMPTRGVGKQVSVVGCMGGSGAAPERAVAVRRQEAGRLGGREACFLINQEMGEEMRQKAMRRYRLKPSKTRQMSHLKNVNGQSKNRV